MKPIRSTLRDALGVVLLALMLGSCAAGTPGTVTDPTAKQEANREKQKELSEMEKAGRRD